MICKEKQKERGNELNLPPNMDEHIKCKLIFLVVFDSEIWLFSCVVLALLHVLTV